MSVNKFVRTFLLKKGLYEVNFKIVDFHFQISLASPS